MARRNKAIDELAEKARLLREFQDLQVWYGLSNRQSSGALGVSYTKMGDILYGRWERVTLVEMQQYCRKLERWASEHVR